MHPGRPEGRASNAAPFCNPKKITPGREYRKRKKTKKKKKAGQAPQTSAKDQTMIKTKGKCCRAEITTEKDSWVKHGIRGKPYQKSIGQKRRKHSRLGRSHDKRPERNSRTSANSCGRKNGPDLCGGSSSVRKKVVKEAEEEAQARQLKRAGLSRTTQPVGNINP